MNGPRQNESISVVEPQPKLAQRLQCAELARAFPSPWNREKRERREIGLELEEKSIHPLAEMALAAQVILLSRIRRVSRFKAVKTFYERGHTNS